MEEREKMRTYERGRETVPSSSAVQLELSVPESLSSNENAPLSIHNSTSPLINISDNSSTISSVDAVRPTQYPSPQSRMNGSSQSYPDSQPSPAYSDASPRDSSTRSPREPIYPQHYPDRRTPHSEELTPQSLESHLSTSSFSVPPSPTNPQHLDIDRSRLTLPPPGIGWGSLIMGTFKCDHAGCMAPAFQTQYLLK